MVPHYGQTWYHTMDKHGTTLWTNMVPHYGQTWYHTMDKHGTTLVKYSNIPGFFWAAACCLYTFPDKRKFAMTASYYIEILRTMEDLPEPLAELKYQIWWHSIKYGSRVVVRIICLDLANMKTAAEEWKRS